MIRIRLLIVALLNLALGLQVVPLTQAAQDCTVPDTALPGTAFERQALAYLNQTYRSALDLQWSDTLSRAAHWMAADMAARNWQLSDLNHTDSLGRSLTQRLAACGYTGIAGENLAGLAQGLNYSDPINYWSSWSSEQWNNMISSQYTHAGFAYVVNNSTQRKNFYVLVVGQAGGVAPPTATPSAVPTATRTPTPVPPTPTRTPTPVPGAPVQLDDCVLTGGDWPGPFNLSCLLRG